MKRSHERAKRLTMRRLIAAYTNASPLAHKELLVVSKLILLFWSIQENVLSTTHRRGNTTNPCCGMNFCQSSATPSLAHSLAQDINTSLGAGFLGRSTRSTLHPRVFSTQSAPLSSPR